MPDPATQVAAHEPEQIPFYRRLVEDVAADIQPLPTAVIYPLSAAALRGALRCAEAGLIEPYLLGPAKKIKALAAEQHVDLQAAKLEDCTDIGAALHQAIGLVKNGSVEALMKGHVQTTELLRAVLDREHGLRTERHMSHVFALDVPKAYYHKPLWLTDAAVNIAPNLEVKRAIVQNAIDLYRACSDNTPKVAVLSATEKITSDLPATLDAAVLCKMAERGDIEGGILEGPLAFDNAISRQAADIKGIDSPVPGEVDILVTPNLEAGNILYKQMKFLSGYNAAGVVMGAQVPIILTSRAGGDQARMASAALALRYRLGRQSQGAESE